jgi:polyisoprenoid-binding protein YceI
MLKLLNDQACEIVRPEISCDVNASGTIRGELIVKTILGTAAALTLAVAGFAQQSPAPRTPVAGVYTMDGNHSSITWRVSHRGTSHYTARFDSFDAKLTFDPKAPDKSSLEVTIDPASLNVNYHDANRGDGYFHDELTGPNFFNVKANPAITFKSTKVEVTGENTGKVTGDLTLLGQTHPVTLDVTFNGVAAIGPGPVIGFSAKTTVKRTLWGLSYAIQYGVGDDVDVSIETEFAGPKA